VNDSSYDCDQVFRQLICTPILITQFYILISKQQITRIDWLRAIVQFTLYWINYDSRLCKLKHTLMKDTPMQMTTR